MNIIVQIGHIKRDKEERAVLDAQTKKLMCRTVLTKGMPMKRF